MAVFWILTGLATALAALLVLAGARRGADATGEASPDPATAALARELGELDRLRTRGLLDDGAWTTARAEAARRLLARPADAPASELQLPTPGRHDPRWALLALALTAAATIVLYAIVGSPGLGDQAYDHRVEQWATSTDPLQPEQVAAVLTREAALQPGDAGLLNMLGAARFQAGDPIGAASAFRRALAIEPENAQGWARLGESLVRSQDGVVGPDAEAAFLEAVRRDPGQLGALFFLGEAALARGDLEGVRTLWTPLIGALDPADPRRIDLERRLAGAGDSAGETVGAAG